MRLSTKARYAVMAMVDIAFQETTEKAREPVSLSAISIRQNLPLAYLEQLFNKLKKANLVTSSRGAAGGYLLSYPPEQIHIFDIMAAVDSTLKPTRCDQPSLQKCGLKGSRCLTHDLWHELGQIVELFFRRITLQDVCSNQVRGKGRLCLGTLETCLTHLSIPAQVHP